MVNRSNKRNQPDTGPDLPDPSVFVENFCCRRNLVNDSLVGTSEVEKSCIRSAEEARQLYKDHRDDELERRGDPVPRTESNQAPGGAMPPMPPQAPVSLSPAQKYSRRLFNNRKSAAAAKVYQDVLKRELATAIQSIPQPAPMDFGKTAEMLSNNSRMEGQLLRLQLENSALVDEKAMAEREKWKLHKENEKLKAKLIAMKSSQGAFAIWHRPQQPPRKDTLKIIDDSQQSVVPTSQDMELVRQMSSQTHIPNSQQFLNNVGNRQASQTSPVTTGTPGPNDVRHNSDLALSPVNPGGNPAEYQTGFTFSQSQKDDSEDVLVRAGHPLNPTLHGPLPFAMGSQSQDLPSMKTPIGSEENPLGDESFYMNSQGSKGS